MKRRPPLLAMVALLATGPAYAQAPLPPLPQEPPPSTPPSPAPRTPEAETPPEPSAPTVPPPPPVPPASGWVEESGWVQETVTPPPKRKRTQLAFRAMGGGDYRRLFDIPVYGGDAGVGLGFELPSPLAIWIAADVFAGVRPEGLGVQMYRVGADFEFRYERVRFGFGLGLGVLSLDRIAGQGQSTWSLMVAARLTVSCDLVRFGSSDRGAFLLFLRLNGESDGSASPWGPSGGVGVRF